LCGGTVDPKKAVEQNTSQIDKISLLCLNIFTIPCSVADDLPKLADTALRRLYIATTKRGGFYLFCCLLDTKLEST